MDVVIAYQSPIVSGEILACNKSAMLNLRKNIPVFVRRPTNIPTQNCAINYKCCKQNKCSKYVLVTVSGL